MEELYLYDAGLHDGDLTPVSGLVRLTDLGLSANGPLDDTALQTIGKLRKLKYLDLRGTAITDGGLPHLAGLQNLKELEVCYGPKLTDAAVPHLSCLRGLKWLWLYGTDVTPDGIRQLQAALPQCTIYAP